MDSYRRSEHRYNRSRTPPPLNSRRHGHEVDIDRSNSSRNHERERSSYRSARSDSHYFPNHKYRSRSRSRSSKDDQTQYRQHTSRSDHYSPLRDTQFEGGKERRKVGPHQSDSGRKTYVKTREEVKENLDNHSQEKISSRKSQDRPERARNNTSPSWSTEKKTKKVTDSFEENTKSSFREYSYKSNKTSNGTVTEKQKKSDYIERIGSSRNHRKRESSSISIQHSPKRLKQSEEAEKSRKTPNTIPSSDKPQLSKESTYTHNSTKDGKKDVYEKLEQVGEGTYGKVFKARNITSNTVVALKRIKVDSEKDGFPLTALREIKLLQSLSHENIIQLPEISYHKGSLYMVFEYMDYDLTGFLAHPNLMLNTSHIKRIMLQILHGIKYLHESGVLHRDLKASNLLLNKRGQLKLADFGLARVYDKCKSNQYTNRVITLWYRPPELLLGGTKYGPEVDMWSVGCIMMELYLRKPLFQGKDEISQLQLIYDLLGTPTPDTWTTICDLPWYRLIQPKEVKERRFEKDFKDTLSPEAFNLVTSLLSMDPSKRPSADQALRHEYFLSELPKPCELKDFPKLDGDWHEYEAKEMRKKKPNSRQHSGVALLHSPQKDNHATKSHQGNAHHRSTHASKEHPSHKPNHTVSNSNRSPKLTSHRKPIPKRREIS